MPRGFRPLCCLALLVLLAACVGKGAAQAPTATPVESHQHTLRVMTFNVRYAAANDGVNVWANRRDLVAKVIIDRHPAVIGTQELLLSQAHDLADRLHGYAWFGRGRNGNEIDAKGNEHMGVFYDTARLKLLGSGDFWLSETPEIAGSSNFGQSLPRMVTWAQFEDRQSGRRFHYFNTHFPYREDAEAVRTRCAALILTRVQQLPQDEPVILTGDFNTTPGRAAHARLTTVLDDAWSTAKVRVGPKNTFQDFGRITPSVRVDWILSRGLGTERSETVTDHNGAVYPSDHYPVVTDFVL